MHLLATLLGLRPDPDAQAAPADRSLAADGATFTLSDPMPHGSAPQGVALAAPHQAVAPAGPYRATIPDAPASWPPQPWTDADSEAAPVAAATVRPAARAAIPSQSAETAPEPAQAQRTDPPAVTPPQAGDAVARPWTDASDEAVQPRIDDRPPSPPSAQAPASDADLLRRPIRPDHPVAEPRETALPSTHRPAHPLRDQPAAAAEMAGMGAQARTQGDNTTDTTTVVPRGAMTPAAQDRAPILNAAPAAGAPQDAREEPVLPAAAKAVARDPEQPPQDAPSAPNQQAESATSAPVPAQQDAPTAETRRPAQPESMRPDPERPDTAVPDGAKQPANRPETGTVRATTQDLRPTAPQPPHTPEAPPATPVAPAPEHDLPAADAAEPAPIVAADGGTTADDTTDAAGNAPSAEAPVAAAAPTLERSSPAQPSDAEAETPAPPPSGARTRAMPEGPAPRPATPPAGDGNDRAQPDAAPHRGDVAGAPRSSATTATTAPADTPPPAAPPQPQPVAGAPAAAPAMAPEPAGRRSARIEPAAIIAAAQAEAAPAPAPAAPPAMSATEPAANAALGAAAMRQIAEAILIDPARDRIELRLDPPELGSVGITLDLDETGMRVTLSAERGETLDLLRRHGEALQRELLAAGFAGTTLDFNRQAPRPRPIRAAEDMAAAALAVAAPTPKTAGGLIDGRLDMRL